jgi:hypothetical protein
MLVTLVQRALNQNLDLDAALARVRQARAAASGAGAELLPTADLGASATFEHQSLRGEFDSVAAGSPGFKRDGHADVVGPSSWEIDLFGGLRRGAAASRDDAQAAEADQAGTREARCSQGSRRGSTLAVRDKPPLLNAVHLDRAAPNNLYWPPDEWLKRGNPPHSSIAGVSAG